MFTSAAWKGSRNNLARTASRILVMVSRSIVPPLSEALNSLWLRCPQFPHPIRTQNEKTDTNHNVDRGICPVGGACVFRHVGPQKRGKNIRLFRGWVAEGDQISRE